MARIFITYSPKDRDIVRKIAQSLTELDLDIWVDWEDIPPTVDWLQEIYRGIEEADTFLYLLSPDSAQSQSCSNELAHAVKNGKRIVPVVIRDTDQKALSPEVSKRNWIFCRSGIDDFQNAIEQIQYTLQTDYEWLKQHRRLQVRALEWERAARNNSFLLRGRDLEEAERELAINSGKNPGPTDLQRLYILASRRDTDRLRRITTSSLIGVILIMLVISLFGILQTQRVFRLQSQLNELALLQTQISASGIPTNLSQFTKIPTTPSTKQPVTTATKTLAVTETSIPQATAPANLNIITKVVQENSGKFILGIITAAGSAVAVYILSILAISLSRSRAGSSYFARTWLTGLVARTSRIAPGATKKMLFRGYTKKLLSESEISRVIDDYFGLPALDPENNIIAPDDVGESLHNAIAEALGEQKPVIITGNAGAGKSTLLARLVYLGLNNKLPDSLKGYQPILVYSHDYEGNLINAIAETLSGRYDLPINNEITQSMLEAGNYLILFDGVSEIGGDQAQGLQEIMRMARHAGYKNNRFLVTSRPSFTFPADVKKFMLQPLTIDIIQKILDRDPQKRKQKKQFDIQLTAFGMNTIEPLLFSMMVTQGEITYSRSQLYELYFCRKMKVTINDSAWDGWRIVLEELAKWFMLDSGRRGIGMPHEKLLSLIAADGDANLVKRLAKYGVSAVKSELELLERLKAAGLLSGQRRWRFAQDTFEEFFSASYIISQLVNFERFPDLTLWLEGEEKQHSFLGAIGFVKEIAKEMSEKKQEHIPLNILSETNLPAIWHEAIFSPQPKGNE